MPPHWAQTGPEKNRGRTEIRTLCTAPISPEQACFPGAAQSAIILRQGLGDQPDVQYLLSSREPERLSPSPWLADQRAYWGIETGLHQRLDVSADEEAATLEEEIETLTPEDMEAAIEAELGGRPHR